jgi:hypothetical protein
MDTLQNLLVGGLIVIVGLIVCFGGYGFWRIALIIGGFVSGYALGASWIPDTQWLLEIMVGIVAAIVAGLLAYFLWSFAMVLAGIILGAVLGAGLMIALNADPSGLITTVGGIAGAVAGGVLVYFVKDLAVIVILAFAGASAVSIGVATALPFLASAADPGATATWLQNLLGISLQVLALIIFFGLGILGSIVQWYLFRSRFKGELYFEEKSATA